MDGRSQCPGEDGIQLHVQESMTQQLLQRLAHAHIVGDAAGEHQPGLQTHPRQQIAHPPGGGKMDACGDILAGFASGPQGNDLGFGEYDTLAADFRRAGGLQRLLSQLINGQLENLRHLFQKPSGAGSALVVHDEFRHVARFRVHPDHLGILAADIDNGPHIRVEIVIAQRMAGNLRHNGCGNISIF
ncbi:hypothetical protein D3C75_720420 [compost metagenome]